MSARPTLTEARPMVLSISMEDAIEDDEVERISHAVLRASLRALRRASTLDVWTGTPEQRGGAMGECANAAIWLEAEMRRCGVAS